MFCYLFGGDPAAGGHRVEELLIKTVDELLQRLAGLVRERLVGVAVDLVAAAVEVGVFDAHFLVQLVLFGVQRHRADRADGRTGRGHHAIGRTADKVGGRGHQRVGHRGDRLAAADRADRQGHLLAAAGRAAGRIDVQHDRLDVRVAGRMAHGGGKLLHRSPAGDPHHHVHLRRQHALQADHRHAGLRNPVGVPADNLAAGRLFDPRGSDPLADLLFGEDEPLGPQVQQLHDLVQLAGQDRPRRVADRLQHVANLVLFIGSNGHLFVLRRLFFLLARFGRRRRGGPIEIQYDALFVGVLDFSGDLVDLAAVIPAEPAADAF